MQKFPVASDENHHFDVDVGNNRGTDGSGLGFRSSAGNVADLIGGAM